MTIELSPAEEAILRRALESGAYEDEADVVRRALGLLEAEIERARHVQERLDDMLTEGVESGEPIPVDDKYWEELKAERSAWLRTEA